MQVEVVRLNDENASGSPARSGTQKRIKKEVVEDTSPSGGSTKRNRYESFDPENDDDEEYDPTRVRAHIIRGPAAFGIFQRPFFMKPNLSFIYNHSFFISSNG